MTWDPEFNIWRELELEKQSNNKDFAELSKKWMQQSVNNKYSYQFEWLGVPIIQMPSDLVVFQQIVFETKPDLIIETGVARGGSAIFWASMQELCGIDGRVIGVDIDVRMHALNAIAESKYSSKIELIVGSSTNQEVVTSIKQTASKYEKVMVVLDSNHTHDHVFEELCSYAEMVSPGCSLLVLDTVIDDLESYPERSWGPGASPKSAVIKYMEIHGGKFIHMKKYEEISKTSVAPYGFWMRT